MCLAIPGKIIEIFEENDIRMGRIDYSGTVRDACLEFVPEARVGEYVIVHAGFAIGVVDEGEAMKTLELWDELEGMASKEGSDLSDLSSNADRDTGK